MFSALNYIRFGKEDKWISLLMIFLEICGIMPRSDIYTPQKTGNYLIRKE